MGERDDWEDLRVGGGLLAVLTQLFGHRQRPLPLRLLRPARARAARPGREHRLRPRRLPPLRADPRGAAAAGDGDDGLPARRRRLVQPLASRGRDDREECRRAGADPERLLIVETSAKFPRTFGILPEHRHALHVDEIDVLVESDKEPLPITEPEPSDDRPRDRRARGGADPRRRDAADRDRRGPLDDRGPARRRRRRRLRRPLGDVHDRPDAAPRGGQGDEPQGLLRRRLGRDVRRRQARALRVARRQRGGRLPPGRAGQLAGGDRRATARW